MKQIKKALYILSIISIAAPAMIGVEARPKRLSALAVAQLTAWKRDTTHAQHHDAATFLDAYDNRFRWSDKGKLQTPVIVSSNLHQKSEVDRKHAHTEDVLAVTNSLQPHKAVQYWHKQVLLSGCTRILSECYALFSAWSFVAAPIAPFGLSTLFWLFSRQMSARRHRQDNKSYQFWNARSTTCQTIQHPDRANRPNEHITLFGGLTQALSAQLKSNANPEGTIFDDNSAESTLTYHPRETCR